jgi:hypothetical protein
MELTDGKSSVTFRLDDPARGVYVPRMLFIKIFGMHVETVCLVVASTHYDMSRSLRSHEAYLEALSRAEMSNVSKEQSFLQSALVAESASFRIAAADPPGGWPQAAQRDSDFTRHPARRVRRASS